LRLFSSRLKNFYWFTWTTMENSTVIREQVIIWETQFHQKY
jgi:hypothetical protein